MNVEITTCQVCGRAIKASTGLIAHHGYRRPYQAHWQTASCEGARYAPYEVSCDRLREVVGMVKGFIASQEEALAAFLATPPAIIRVNEKRGSWGKEDWVDHAKPEDFKVDGYYGTPRTYGLAYSNWKYEYTRTIKAARADLYSMERRLSEWKAPVATKGA